MKIFEKININLIKIRPVGAELFYACGQTDRHDGANSRFSTVLRTRLKTSNFGNKAYRESCLCGRSVTLSV
jgi:hypothetical protein